MSRVDQVTAGSDAEATVSEAISVVDPIEDETWQALSRAGSLFSSPPWLATLRQTYGFHLEAWVTLTADGKAGGGLPLARLGTGPWCRLSTLPFSDYCNPIDRDGSSWAVLAERLAAEEAPAEIRWLSDTPPATARGMRVEGDSDLWHAIALDDDEQRAWDRLEGGARRAIRKARSSDIEVRVTTDPDSLRRFYDLHLGTRKHKYRLLAQPYGFFANLQTHFGDDMMLLGAWHGEDLVAGILLLVWGETLYYKFNASSPDALEARPNDLLMWEATRLGASRGLLTLDLGRTDSDHHSLARYKSKYATHQSRIHTIRRGEPRRDPAVVDILGPLTELLTAPHVPDRVTEEAGNLVYRHFA